jgi:PPOX class probable F420-dependent enzyme
MSVPARRHVRWQSNQHMIETEETAVPKPPLPDKLTDVLVKPNPAVIAVVDPTGQPVSVPTWYVWDDGRILVNMDEGRQRLGYLRENPQVAVTVLAGADWYSHISMRGRVVELTNDPDMADIDRISTHYTGKPYPVRDRVRVSAWIAIDQWHSWGELRDA